MAFKTVSDLSTDLTVSLGGYNKKEKKDNPTSAEGYYLGKRKIDSQKAKSGFTYIYVLQTPAGNLGVWGKTDLDRKMQSVALGHMIRITQTGTVPTNKGNDMYKYTVEFDPDNTIEVTQLEAGSSDAGPEAVRDSEPEADDTEEDNSAANNIAAERAAKVQELLNSRKTTSSRK